MNINYTVLDLMVLNKIILFFVWGVIGIFLGLYINKLNNFNPRRARGKYGYLKLILIDFIKMDLLNMIIIIFIFLNIILYIKLILSYFIFNYWFSIDISFIDLIHLNVYNYESNCFNMMSDNDSTNGVDSTKNSSTNNTININNNNNNNPNNNSSNSNLSKAADTGIMAVALSSGAKIAAKSPTTAGKTAAVGGSIVAGGLAIVAKNIASNLSSNIGKGPNFTDIDSIFRQIFQLTGNDVLDLLYIINVFHFLQLLSLGLLIYYIIIYLIDLSYLEKILLKILPVNITNYILKSLNFIRPGDKYVKYLIIILLILNIFVNIQSYIYFDFIYSNFDRIVDLYIKNR